MVGLIGDHGDYQLGVRSSRGYVWRFLLGAMPALGFIGTVMGIGDALMGTGSVLSDELGKQQSGVSTVALALGFAFDTTFIALVLSLAASFATSWLTSAEEQVVFAAQRNALDSLLRHVRDATPSAAYPAAPAAPVSPPAPAGRLAGQAHNPALPPWRLEILARSAAYATAATQLCRPGLFRGGVIPIAAAAAMGLLLVAGYMFVRQ